MCLLGVGQISLKDLFFYEQLPVSKEDSPKIKQP